MASARLTGEAESAGSWSLSGQNLPPALSAASSMKPQWTDFPRGAISHQVQASLGLTSQAGGRDGPPPRLCDGAKHPVGVPKDVLGPQILTAREESHPAETRRACTPQGTSVPSSQRATTPTLQHGALCMHKGFLPCPPALEHTPSYNQPSPLQDSGRGGGAEWDVTRVWAP